MAQDPVHYVPIFTTLVATAFSIVLYRHWRRRPQARYLLWWTIGVFLYGVGTLTEAITTLTGWHGIVFRAWYISGAPDPRWDNDALVNELSQVKGSDFEAVDESSLMIDSDSGQAHQNAFSGSTPGQVADDPGGSGSGGCFISSSRPR